MCVIGLAVCTKVLEHDQTSAKLYGSITKPAPLWCRWLAIRSLLRDCAHIRCGRGNTQQIHIRVCGLGATDLVGGVCLNWPAEVYISRGVETRVIGRLVGYATK